LGGGYIVIEKCNKHLVVYSNIYFDENVFCIRPYIFLAAFKDSDLGWPPNSIGIAIHDYDDFDIGLIYKTEEEHFMNVLHELINWMYDHEQGISLYKALLNPFEFFPNCNCERISW
jgi:hypothetical protein